MKLIDDISETNDDPELTDKQREAKIKKLFAQKKITVVFR